MKVACVILAAGAGTRMGGVAKALLRRGDATFLARIVETAQASGVIVVVGPPHGDTVAPHAQELGARVVVNPQPERGMASSVALGFGELDRALATLRAAAPGKARACGFDVDADAAWLWPVDHPDVARGTLDALIAALGTHEVARPVHAGRGGHPPLIARRLWPRLAACAEAPDGARGVIAAADVIAVPVDDVGVVRDVDTPEAA